MLTCAATPVGKVQREQASGPAMWRLQLTYMDSCSPGMCAGSCPTSCSWGLARSVSGVWCAKARYLHAGLIVHAIDTCKVIFISVLSDRRLFALDVAKSKCEIEVRDPQKRPDLA